MSKPLARADSTNDVTLTPKQYQAFSLLLDGHSVPQIALIMGQTQAYVQGNILPRILRTLKLALPPDLTFYHLFAQEYMRRQDNILRPQVLERIMEYADTTCVLPDAEIDARLVEFAAEDRRQYQAAHPGSATLAAVA